MKAGVPRLSSTATVLTVAAAMVATGVVVAGAHDGRPTKKVIHACVDDRTGAIEIVGANDHCGAGESPLDWNGKGPRGPQGPPGPPGETGFEHLEVVTATRTQVTAAGAVEGVQGNGPPTLGVGVDCPGDSIAVGGGGSGSSNRPQTPPAPAGPGSTFGVPLIATHPLEKHSTTDAAETGDEPTGWFAMLSDGRFFLDPAQGTSVQQRTQTVTVWAVCTDAGLTPPDEDG